MSVTLNDAAPYQQTVSAVIAALGADAQCGLSQSDAQKRLEQFGRNELTAEEPVPAWRKFLAQFKDVLVILLIIAAAISAVLWLVERESAIPYEAIAILAVVLLNAIMGYVQQARRVGGSGTAANRGGSCKCHPRRESSECRGDGDCARRSHCHRGRRHHSRRCAPDSIHRTANGGGRTYGRKPACVQGH